MPGKDQIKVLSKLDFKKFCDKCQHEEDAVGRLLDDGRVKELTAGDALGGRRPASGLEVG